MSFWADSPGPTWWDCVESLNPCIQSPYGISRSDLSRKPRSKMIPRGLALVLLNPKHAEKMCSFLKENFVLYPRSRISLTKERIYAGLLNHQWIGVAVFTADKQMVGCCVSKPLGKMKFTHEVVDQGGVVDYFCVHRDYRKQGLATCMLQELTYQTAQKQRDVHIFLKEGFPLWNLPPLYHSQYISRRTDVPGDEKEYCGSQGIEFNTPIVQYTHADYFPLRKFAANLPSSLSGDSELFGFNYKGHDVYLCMTDLHHCSVPEGDTIGELSWILPKTIEVPLSIQRLAVETCVDSSRFDIVIMDSKIPHDTRRPWGKDATYSWYIFNYNPGEFFKVKPFWIL